MSTTYKPEQLPFEEFEDVVRNLKKKIDDNAPHYPLVAKAIDRQGLVLMQQSFIGPNKRPAAEVLNHLKEWSVPVQVVIVDASGMETRTVVERITVRNPEPGQHSVQLGLEDMDIFRDED